MTDITDVGVCDFCAAPEPVWLFPAGDFLTGTANEDGVHASVGAFAACEDCRALVEEGLEPLLEHAVDRYMERTASPPSHRPSLTRALRQFYESFYEKREGPPVRIRDFAQDCEHPRVVFSEYGKGSWFLPTGYYCAACGSPVEKP